MRAKSQVSQGREMSAEQRIAAYCAQCRSRCGCTAIVEDGRLKTIEPLPEHPTGKAICPKGRASGELVNHPDRLTTPLRRISPKGETPARWEPVGWDEALNEIATRMGAIRDKYGPEQVAFSVTTPSGTHISDSIAWIERFIRAYGSPNTIYSTEICNWHKDHAAQFTYGHGIGTPDFANTDCALIWGHNPATTWLARSGEIREARGRGMKTVVVEPRRTLYAKRADVWLRLRPGTDQALALGLIHLLLESRTFDAGFVHRWTNAACLVGADGQLKRDGDELRRADDMFADGTVLSELRKLAAEWTPERTEEVTGVPRERLHDAVRVLSESASVAYYCWNGVGQSVSATQTDRAISILYSLLGHYGSDGGNVPGAAVRFNDISGRDLVTDEQRAKTLGLPDRPLGPGREGWVTARDVYRAILDGEPYPVRMLVSFGGNLLSAQPDTALAREARSRLDFHVHADFFLNDSAQFADIILPAATSWEREGLHTGFDVSLAGLNHVQLRQAVVPPLGESRSDTDIVLGLSERLGMGAQMFGCNRDAGWRHVLAPSGVSLDDLRANPAGMTAAGNAPVRAYERDGFPTPSGLIEIWSETLAAHGQDPLPVLRTSREAMDARFPLRLGCAKTVAYCHSQGRNIPALRGLTPDPLLEMAPETASPRGIDTGDWVEVMTERGSFAARAKLVEDHMPGAVFAQHGWIGEHAGLTTNMNTVISTDASDPVSGSIPLRCSFCEIRPIDDGRDT